MVKVSAKGVDMSLGGVQGMPGPYTSAVMLGSTCGAGPPPSDPMSASPDEMDGPRLIDPSMLVGGEAQPVWSL